MVTFCPMWIAYFCSVKQHLNPHLWNSDTHVILSLSVRWTYWLISNEWNSAQVVGCHFIFFPHTVVYALMVLLKKSFLLQNYKVSIPLSLVYSFYHSIQNFNPSAVHFIYIIYIYIYIFFFFFNRVNHFFSTKLVSSDCHNKILLTRSFKQQNFIFSVWGYKSKIKVLVDLTVPSSSRVAKSWTWLNHAPILAGCRLLTWCLPLPLARNVKGLASLFAHIINQFSTIQLGWSAYSDVMLVVPTVCTGYLFVFPASPRRWDEQSLPRTMLKGRRYISKSLQSTCPCLHPWGSAMLRSGFSLLPHQDLNTSYCTRDFSCIYVRSHTTSSWFLWNRI